MKQTPIYQSYVHIAPNPLGWPTLLTKVGEPFKKRAETVDSVLLRSTYRWENIELCCPKEPSWQSPQSRCVTGITMRATQPTEFCHLQESGERDGNAQSHWLSATVRPKNLCLDCASDPCI